MGRKTFRHNQSIFTKKRQDKLQLFVIKTAGLSGLVNLRKVLQTSLSILLTPLSPSVNQKRATVGLGYAPFAQELHAEGGLLACRALTSMVETINHGEDGASGDVKAQ